MNDFRKLYSGQRMYSPEIVIGHYAHGHKNANVGLIKCIDTGEVVAVDNSTVKVCDEEREDQR